MAPSGHSLPTWSTVTPPSPCPYAALGLLTLYRNRKVHYTTRSHELCCPRPARWVRHPLGGGEEEASTPLLPSLAQCGKDKALPSVFQKPAYAVRQSKVLLRLSYNGWNPDPIDINGSFAIYFIRARTSPNACSIYNRLKCLWIEPVQMAC